MKITLTLFFSFFLSFICLGQENTALEKAYYWVTFTDKNQNPFSTDQPEAFLGPLALERRKKFNIPITESDLPVNPNYLERVKEFQIKIHNTSRWLNAATILADKQSIKAIEDLSFVDEIQKVGKEIKRPPRMRSVIELDTIVEPFDSSRYYGRGTRQISMLNGQKLHELGYRGRDKRIGVLDGGFFQLDVLPFFDSIRLQSKIIATKDFVEGDSLAIEGSAHGTKVLSTMASNVPGLLVGTAPDADYLCIKTEDTRAEYLVEICNWVAGIEYADSMGCDIITSSLGYNTFTDKKMNFSYGDMTGVNSIGSIAADIGFQKGMIVITSAGNEGHTKWKHIDVPSDAINILAVGSVDREQEKAYFSSIGPTADGRIKPELVALGLGVRVASPYAFETTTDNGTSVSTPLIAGLIASLWQAFPNHNNKEILTALYKSASQYGSPDNELGYGIPDFEKAYFILLESSKLQD